AFFTFPAGSERSPNYSSVFILFLSSFCRRFLSNYTHHRLARSPPIFSVGDCIKSWRFLSNYTHHRLARSPPIFSVGDCIKSW
ncbi:unnamed protein product, partial [Musa banksii]